MDWQNLMNIDLPAHYLAVCLKSCLPPLEAAAFPSGPNQPTPEVPPVPPHPRSLPTPVPPSLCSSGIVLHGAINTCK